MPASAIPLPELLHRVFGHREFRAHQQPVCEAATAGRNVLLVMPTGAGKSLCYQLPALARGGTALVISPLIALMDDQANNLAALNLRVARIHSGLSRESAREACRDYLAGNLDFLFIAPERLRVPGFPEMLAKRKPALIAIDEAHCISQWGHDFRPDYRMLGQHLPALRPSPVIALTATATPSVQQDIVRALELRDPAVFITGFRRTNLHIEVTELSKPQRTGFITRLLASPDARPAIVYASSRKSAEELAGALASKFTTAPYHAGLDPGTRERVQRHFLSGTLDVVVATVAFGMGVDKADVRTVVHAALPGSVEAYYQEIGRAGRDGQPSRAVLLHNFADRRTQEFLLERNYPAVSDLERVAAALPETPAPLSSLSVTIRQLDRETVERCAEKLVAQGVAAADYEGNLWRASQAPWQREYDAQVRYRREQIQRMIDYAEGTQCRMLSLVRHFGDRADAGRSCGHCDICQPAASISAPARQPSKSEETDLLALLHGLKSGPRSSGKLFTDLKLTKDRRHFETLVDALARAGLVHIAQETFRTDDGKDVAFRKLSLTSDATDVDSAALATVWLRSTESAAAPSRSASRKTRSSASSSSASSSAASEAAPVLSPSQASLYDKLKSWRLGKAKEAGIPAFTIFHDSVLTAIACTNPRNLEALKTVRGIGLEKLDRFGAEVLALCRAGEQPAAPRSPSRTTPPKARPVTSATAPPSLPPAGRHVSPGLEPRLPNRPSIPAKPPAPEPPQHLTPEQELLADRLRSWRRDQAATDGLPTFFVLSETALRRVALARPQSLEELRTIPEVGPDKVARFGASVLSLCRAQAGAGSGANHLN